MKAKKLWFGTRNGEVYEPVNFSSEAEICLLHCPQPNKPCKGTCPFFETEIAKIRGNGRREIERLKKEYCEEFLKNFEEEKNNDKE